MTDTNNKKFCVIGDVMVDYYRIVEPTRISPEAPVMIMEPRNEYKTPGGAANVANNLVAMGATPGNVRLFSVVGCDWPEIAGEGFLPCSENMQRQPRRLTTVKERIVAGHQQLMRIDKQTKCEADKEYVKKLRDAALDYVACSDVVVLSDYNHGVMSRELIRMIIEETRRLHIPTVVDSKAPDTLTKYAGSTVALPTSKEARTFEDMPQNLSLEQMASFIVENMQLDALGMTLGKDGILLARRLSSPVLYPALANDPDEEVADVTGAGDTVTASVAIGLTLGWSYDRIMRLANLTAGIVVRKKGVATCSPDEITEMARATNIDIGER